MADDLLAGLESTESRQLKWSLKLEPTCREGEQEKERGGRWRWGGIGEEEFAYGHSTSNVNCPVSADN